MSAARLPDGYFEDLYAADPDPWKFATRWYEHRKRALTMAALPHPRYRAAFEPGCGPGFLTQELAARCDRVLATDVVDQPLRTARARLRGLAVGDNVEFRRWALGDEWPAERFDLIVLSEVGYYLFPADLQTAIDESVDHLDTGAALVCVHWRHPVSDYPLTGDQVHTLIGAHPRLTSAVHYTDKDFVLDIYGRAGDDAISVADREGLTRQPDNEPATS
ncbi:class I SAM-dependent DNA methyltransferase [Nocardia sp. NPDC004722]